MPNSQTKLKKVEEVTEDLLYNLYPKSNCGCGGYTDYDRETPRVIKLLTQDRQHIERVLVEKLEKLKLLEVAVNPETLLWKQRINAKVDQAITLVKEVLQGK